MGEQVVHLPGGMHSRTNLPFQYFKDRDVLPTSFQTNLRDTTHLRLLPSVWGCHLCEAELRSVRASCLRRPIFTEFLGNRNTHGTCVPEGTRPQGHFPFAHLLKQRHRKVTVVSFGVCAGQR